MEAFNDIFEDCTSLGTKIPKDNYLSEGKYIVVDQGQNIIAGYTNEEDGLYEDVPAITDALKDAKSRGVEIRFVYDETPRFLLYA